MTTIKALQQKIELVMSDYDYGYRQALRWNKKHCNWVAKHYIEQINYMQDVIKSFPHSFIEISEDLIMVNYSTGYGKISISDIEHSVLIPAIYQEIDNKRIVNNSTHLKVA